MLSAKEIKVMVKRTQGKESLRQKQSRACLMHSYLIQYAFEQGYELTDGDAYRDPRAFGELGEKGAYGAKSSCHKLRLARDYNLFLGGKWLNKSSEFEALGVFWESIGGSWGGRWGDGNHFSVEHNGHR